MDYEQVLERIKLQLTNNDVPDGINDLKLLYNCFSDLIQALLKNIGSDGITWYEYLHDINHKFLFCTSSIITLIESFYNELDTKGYHDISSVFILNRSLIETYLTFLYCYKLPASEEEALANYYIFKISGLTQWSNYSGREQDKIDNQKLEIQALQKKLEENSFFKHLQLSKSIKQKLVDGKYALRYSFPQLIEISSLSNELFINRWKLYSNYAHSEAIGLIQMCYYSNNIKSAKSGYYLTVMYPLMLMSCYYVDLLEMFKDRKYDIGDHDEDLLTIIHYWRGMSRATPTSI